MKRDLVQGISGAVWWLWTRSHAAKTYDYFLATLERLIRSVYTNRLGGEFIDILGNLVQGQLRQAYDLAWSEKGNEGAMPEYLTSALENAITTQYKFIDQFFRDIVDARIDGTGIDALLARAPLWAQRYNEAYNDAVRLILAENGGNLVWQLGATEQHCPECYALNGIVASAKEWDELGVHPQGAPNPLLTCGGWRCDCSLTPTTRRRSPKAFDTIVNIVSSKA